MITIDAVDHVALIKLYTATEYSNSTVLSYTQALNTGHNELDGVFVDMSERLDFENQEGETLEIIGRIVGQDRTVIVADGNRRLTDEEYKLFIAARIFKNNMQSTPEQTIEAYSTLLGLSPIVIDDAHPRTGHGRITTLTPLTTEQKDILLNTGTLPKTIGVTYKFAEITGDGPFAFLGFPGALGFGDENDFPITGGVFPNDVVF